MVAALNEQATAIDAIRAWRSDPVLFVRQVFGAEPDAWQRDALAAVARDPKVAMSACKGPGKSCLLAWVIWWFLATNVDAQVIAVSITSDNLKDNLWKELALWQSKSPLLQKAFEWGAERIKSIERPATWWCSARSFARASDATQQANTLAGFHGQNILVVLDELGDYPEGVLSAAEAIFANDVNAKLVVAGNPTSTSGSLYRVVKQSQGWHVIFITGDPDDPKRSPRISLRWAQEEIAKWGRENPWIMVNILGEFPPAGENQLISVNDVLAAMSRDVPALSYRTDPIIWGVDPSVSLRAGADEAALARRQGVLARKLHVWRGKDGPELASAIGRLILEAEQEGQMPDAIFVDAGGVGRSCYDHLIHLGYEDVVVQVDFGGAAGDARFLNKRAEMWWGLSEWVHSAQSCLPSDPVLQAELPGPTFKFRAVNKQTKFQLESKDDMKARGVASPNRADALALTFAAPVARKGREARAREDGGRSARALTEYDPLGGA